MNQEISFFTIPAQLDFEVSLLLLAICSLALVMVSLKLAITNNLLESVILMSIFSVLISSCYLLLDAPDVAMTETALGACLSTCVLLNLVNIFGRNGKSELYRVREVAAFILCLAFSVVLIIIGFDLPVLGNANSPVNSHISSYYLENTQDQIGIPSVVAAILASYRGFDTLGETTVILIAGLSVVIILANKQGQSDAA